jgi:16S rRNA (cytosine1402-N4)-methyltransferase
MHIPVLAETIEELHLVQEGQHAVDCTSGLGGHTKILAAQVGVSGTILAIEWDKRNLKQAQKKLPLSQIIWIHDNYKNIYAIIKKQGLVGNIHLVLFDLGVSSLHFDEPERGFSFKKDAPLDMRYDRTQKWTAADLINDEGEEELTAIFRNFGEEPYASRIAKNIVQARKAGIIRSTTELSALIESALPQRINKIDSFKRVFQALRIAVNDELSNLKQGLEGAFNVLAPQGKIAAISYHSLEDRIVKQFFKEKTEGCTCPKNAPLCICGKVPQAALTPKKPIVPSETEIKNNPRARSAHLRILQKLSS